MIDRPVVLQATPRSTRNPYYRLFAEPLANRGWDYRFEPDLDALLATLQRFPADQVVVHLHQLEPFYRAADRSAVQRDLRALSGFAATATLRGARMVHTMHNAQPHDGKFLAEDRYATEMIGSLASRVIVLGERARRHGEGITTPERVRVLPHPRMDVYGALPGRREARRRLAIPDDAFVYLSLGEFKPYKQHHVILEAFARMSLPGTRLFIVGPPTAADYAADLERRALRLGRDRVRVVAHPVPEDLMPTWFAAADCGVFAFPRLLMSGSVMLTLSYGLPVIAPDVGCVGEYVHHGSSGLLYEPDDVASLARALARMRREADRLTSGVKGSVDHLHAKEVAGLLDGIYREALADRWGTGA